jgi:hypothetical protein
MRAIGAELGRIARPVLGKRGLGEAQLLRHWDAIMGEELAGAAWPDRLSFSGGERRDGTLRLRVEPGAALLLQHKEPILLERINGFFGYRAVARLAYVQAAPRRREQRAARPRKLEPAEEESVESRVAAVDDPELREALGRLGRAVLGSSRKP